MSLKDAHANVVVPPPCPLLLSLQDKVIMLVIARLFGSVYSQRAWLLGAVVYPTRVRSTGHSWSQGIARFGALAAAAIYFMSVDVGQRCKLDPGLKAPPGFKV